MLYIKPKKMDWKKVMLDRKKYFVCSVLGFHQRSSSIEFLENLDRILLQKHIEIEWAII